MCQFAPRTAPRYNLRHPMVSFLLALSLTLPQPVALADRPAKRPSKPAPKPAEPAPEDDFSLLPKEAAPNAATQAQTRALEQTTTLGTTMLNAHQLAVLRSE